MTEFKRSQFCMDAIPDRSFHGYTQGDTWNGFACPYFEKSVAEQVLEASAANGFSWIYNRDRDVYEIKNTQDPPEYEPEEFEGKVITMDGQDMKVYAIGAYSWIWEECE